jgi:GNAT superfamily N-acetyltransferase
MVCRRENGRVSDYRLSEDPTDLDMDRVVRWISTDAYWAKGRTPAVIERSFANSIPVGLYTPGRMQVAVARIVSDRATFAWLCDVYVDPSRRGAGVGTALLEAVSAELSTWQVKRALLATADAHGVYERFGFTALEQPERWMARSFQTS